MLPKDKPEDIAMGANAGQQLSAYALWCRNKNWLAKRRFFRRYWRVVREWPADRFLPTTDLDLSIDERSALARDIF
jgi:hypothetical protein